MPQRADNWQTEFAKRWLKYWLPPARPTKSQLIYIRKIIRDRLAKNKNLQVLVLGSTSEFRDMLIELRIKPTIVDFSKENYKILSKKMRHNYTGKENFVCADWLKMNLNKEFDIILSEASLNVVSKKDWPKLLNNICRHLKSDGLLISKTWRRLKNKENFKLEDLLKKYRKIIRRKDFISRILMTLYLTVYDAKKDYVFLPEVYPEVKKLYKTGKVSQGEWGNFEKLGMNLTPFKFFMPEKKWLEKELKKYFLILDIEYSDYYYNQYYPIYVLTKK